MKEKEGLTPRIPNFNTRRTRQVGLHNPAAIDSDLETDSHMAVTIAAIMKRYVTKLQDIQVNSIRRSHMKSKLRSILIWTHRTGCMPQEVPKALGYS